MTDHPDPQIGARLRAARKRAGMSQHEVAEQSGLSPSFVRMVELGRSDISLSRLLRWAALFQLSVADLFGTEPTDLVLRVPPEERMNVHTGEHGVRFQLLAPTTHQELEPAMFTLAPNAAMRKNLTHRGEEAVFVVSGRAALYVAGSTYELSSGACAYYKSSHPHRFANLDPATPTELLVTTSHPAVHFPNP